MVTAEVYPPFSRNFEDEQDYVNARGSVWWGCSPLAGIVMPPPSLRWKRTAGDVSPRCEVKTLFVAFEESGISFVRKCFGVGEQDWVGTLVLCEARPSPAGGDTLDPTDPVNSACNIFRKGDMALVLCGYEVSPGESHAWAEEILSHISSETVVIFAAVPAGQTGASIQVVATMAAEERGGLMVTQGFQRLMTPTLLTGAPAALISHCQRRDRAAVCFVAVMGTADTIDTEKMFHLTVESLKTLAGDAVTEPQGTCPEDKGLQQDYYERMGNLYL
ncbi:unnamed protein product [Discosporangium mesarthrocarpum]